MKRKRNDQTRLAPAQPPASGQSAGQRLSQQDIDVSADELVDFLRRWADVWPRREQRDWSAFYLRARAAALGEKIRAEDGVAAAVAVIERHAAEFEQRARQPAESSPKRRL